MHPEALNYWLKSVEEAPSSNSIHESLGVCYVKLNKLEEATDAFKRALQLQPYMANFSCYYFLIQIFRISNDIESMLFYINEGIKHNTDTGYFQYQKGVYFSTKGDAEEALKWYELSIILEPDFALPYNDIAAIYQQRGDSEKALNYLLRGIEANPDVLIIHENLMRIYMQSMDLEKVNYHKKRIQEIEIKNLLA